MSILRTGAAEATYTIKREEVQPPTVIFKMLPGSIGYVCVMAFGKATPFEFDTAIARLKNQEAKALVLDLRNDGGGYVDSALAHQPALHREQSAADRRRARKPRHDHRCRQRHLSGIAR